MKTSLKFIAIISAAVVVIGAMALARTHAQSDRDPMVTSFQFRDWKYEYTIGNFGTKSQKEWGSLGYGGKSLDARSMPDLGVNDYFHTPWGTLYWWGERGVTFSRHGWLPHPSPYAKKTGKRLTPPDAESGRILVAVADHGRTVVLTQGDELVVRLGTLSTEDRSWRVTGGSPRILRSASPPVEIPLHLPGWESLNRQMFHFRVANSGTTMLVLRHGGESGKEWKVNIEVKEK